MATGIASRWRHPLRDLTDHRSRSAPSGWGRRTAYREVTMLEITEGAKWIAWRLGIRRPSAATRGRPRPVSSRPRERAHRG